ncbi:MAG: response regulator [Planctomycetes bacterium]|nr:response regulator [Planctomycetota bacterium]
MTSTSDHLSLIARRLLEATSRSTGDDLFVAMAQAITEALGARWAFVGELISSTRVRTRAGWTEGAPIAPVEYDLEGTPCAQVLWQDACGYPSDVQEQFPDDHMLVEMGVQSYFGVPVFGSRGKAIGIIVALHDAPLYVDQYKDLLDLFALRVGAELERERIDRLLRQNERLESLGLLAGGVAHDFNNLLTAIMANVGLATSQLGRIPDAEIADLLTDVEHAAKTAAGLTRQLLAYSGKVRRRQDVVDFAALVGETVKMVRPLLPEKAHLRFDLPEGLPAVEGDMIQLRQVVMNLVRNAGDALVGREGVIRVQAAVASAFAAGYDAITYQAEDFAADRAHLALTVSDTGDGMDTGALAKMFVPFFTTKANGHGFGLAITAGILGRHRGAIAVRSAPGEGTTMTVYLPLAATGGGPPQDAAEASFAGTRVLIADDEPRVRDSLARALQQLGCEVVEAVDGEQALRALREVPRRIDCAVLNLFMPGLGGDEIALALHGDRDRVPIVLNSGLQPQAMDDYLRSGTVAAALSEPWTGADLRAALRAALPARSGG